MAGTKESGDHFCCEKDSTKDINVIREEHVGADKPRREEQQGFEEIECQQCTLIKTREPGTRIG